MNDNELKIIQEKYKISDEDVKKLSKTEPEKTPEVKGDFSALDEATKKLKTLTEEIELNKINVKIEELEKNKKEGVVKTPLGADLSSPEIGGDFSALYPNYKKPEVN